MTFGQFGWLLDVCKHKFACCGRVLTQFVEIYTSCDGFVYLNEYLVEAHVTWWTAPALCASHDRLIYRHTWRVPAFKMNSQCNLGNHSAEKVQVSSSLIKLSCSGDKIQPVLWWSVKCKAMGTKQPYGSSTSVLGHLMCHTALMCVRLSFFINPELSFRQTPETCEWAVSRPPPRRQLWLYCFKVCGWRITADTAVRCSSSTLGFTPMLWHDWKEAAWCDPEMK